VRFFFLRPFALCFSRSDHPSGPDLLLFCLSDLPPRPLPSSSQVFFLPSSSSTHLSIRSSRLPSKSNGEADLHCSLPPLLLLADQTRLLPSTARSYGSPRRHPTESNLLHLARSFLPPRTAQQRARFLRGSAEREVYRRSWDLLVRNQTTLLIKFLFSLLSLSPELTVVSFGFSQRREPFEKT